MSLKFDDREVQASLRKRFTVQDMLAIEGSGARIVINSQRLDVPRDTGTTRNSIGSHIKTATKLVVEDHIGPETDYAPAIELGIASKPNYPIQPFVRPSIFGSNQKVVLSAISTAFKAVVQRLYGRG